LESNQKLKEKLRFELQKDVPNPKAIAELSDAILNETEGSVRFTVDAQHINRLGLELVGKQETALSELIKNAYDADATKVEISFRDFERAGGELIISDNGVGMDIDTIRNSWMRLSTNAKGENPVSDVFKRQRAGRKGIGRFAVQRLGTALVLETGQTGQKLGLRVVFSWDEDFKAGTSLNQVWHDIETFEKDEADSGTILKIRDLRDRWTKATLERVWKSVLFLQVPFRARQNKTESPDNFLVSINGVTNRQQRIDLNMSDNFLNNAVAQISGSIDSSGTAEFKVVSDRLGIDETFRSDDVYHFVGPLSFSSDYFIYLSQYMSGISVRVAEKMGHNYGGIRVYRNGFRVLPYGEQNDDWLKLSFDSARRNLLVPANNFNFFGQVDVDSQSNPLLEETSSREGFIENEAFEELQLFCRRCLEWATLRVGSIRKRKTSTSQQDFTPTYTRKPSDIVLEKLTEEEKKIGELIGDNTSDSAKKIEDLDSRTSSEHDTDFLKELYSKQREYERKTEERIELSIEYENMLRILASLGISISLFGHEIKSATTAVDNSLAVAEIDVEKLADDSERGRLEEDISSLKSATDRIFDLGSYVEALVSKTRSRELIEVHVDTAVRQFLGQFQSYMQKRNIEFEVDVKPLDLLTPKMHASELDSALFNFLTNSVKAIEKAGTAKPMVKVSGRQDGDFVVVSFEDNGAGVPEELEERVFDAFFTTTETDGDSISGIGTGLGLQIVQDIASAYGGSVSLSKNVSSGYSTRFDLKFRKNN